MSSGRGCDHGSKTILPLTPAERTGIDWGAGDYAWKGKLPLTIKIAAHPKVLNLRNSKIIRAALSVSTAVLSASPPVFSISIRGTEFDWSQWLLNTRKWNKIIQLIPKCGPGISTKALSPAPRLSNTMIAPVRRNFIRFCRLALGFVCYSPCIAQNHYDLVHLGAVHRAAHWTIWITQVYVFTLIYCSIPKSLLYILLLRSYNMSCLGCPTMWN
jgi:hypothetical protein